MEIEDLRQASTLWPARAAATQKDVPAPVRTVLDWITNVIVKPHADLGRPGVLCPFVPPALKLDMLWLTMVRGRLTRDAMCRAIEEQLGVYDSLPAPTPESVELKTLVVVFPDLEEHAAATLIESAHQAMKPLFVNRGLMLGEFHAEHRSPGLYNAAFFPLRSPLPLFVFRQMVVNDLVFLGRSSEPAERRVRFLTAYLQSLRHKISAEKLRQAEDALALAHRQMRSPGSFVIKSPDVTRQSAIRAMSQKVREARGIDLGQGSYLLEPDARLVEAAVDAMRGGRNSYTPCEGIPELRAALARKYTRHNDLPLRADEVIVTSGASGALESACAAFLRPGDEVLVFAPFYPYHANVARAHGAVLKPVVLEPPDWKVSGARLAAAVSPRTKMLVFANPANPTGKVFSRDELQEIANVCREHDLIAVVDEVYEYLTYDGARHVTLASLPGMFERTLTIASAGKTFCVTGWRVGWIAGPADAMSRIAVLSDRMYVCAPAPLQHAVAAGLEFGDEFFERARVTLAAKRQALVASLTAAGLRPERPQGACYIMARHLSNNSDEDAAVELLTRTGVGSVPGSAFQVDDARTGLLRFCFAVSDNVLADAGARLLARERVTNTNVHRLGGAVL